jgi:hypothetical protein
MKKLIILVFLISGISLLAQNHAGLKYTNSFNSEFPVIHQSLRYAMIQDDQIDEKLTYEDYYKLYQSASSIRTTGIILTSVGIPTTLTGLVLLGAAFGQAWGGDDAKATRFGVSGLALSITGLGTLIAGTVLWASGGRKRTKYRNEMKERWPDKYPGKKYLSLNLSQNGAGLAFNF